MSSIAHPSVRRPASELFGNLRRPALIALAYYAGAEAAFAIGTLSDKIFAPFWPPNIILCCALLFAPARLWWLYLLAVFPAHVIAELRIGMSAPQLLVAYATNCAIAVGNAWAIKHFLGEPPWFDSIRKAGLYVLISAVVVPAVVSLGGAFVPILGGGGIQHYWLFWVQWCLANTVSSLALGPAILVWVVRRRMLQNLTIGEIVEGLLLIGGLFLVCAVVFTKGANSAASGLFPALLYLPLPLIVWSAIRFGQVGASSAVLVVTVTLLWSALNGHSLFITETPDASVFAIQAFVVGLAVPVLLLGAAIDETRRAERATRASEERMAFAAVAADLCLWHFDYKSDRFWITDHGRQMLGFTADELVTRRTFLEALHADDREAAREAIRSAASSGSLADIEFRIARRDGSMRWLRARARADRDERGEISAISGTFADVTDRKLSENELAQQRRDLAHLMRVSMLGELSGGIAHELAQPLTAILSNAQAARMLMDSETVDLVEVTAALDDIIAEDNRAGEVIHRMRGLLKRGETKFEPVDLNELIRSSLRLLNSELIARRIKCQCDLSENLPLAPGDPVQLQQVLLNLVMNAVEAMNEVAPSRRIVSLRTTATEDGRICITVSDCGVGLTPPNEEQLFQPFFTTKERGLGLGLTICTSIVKSHGGTLKLENNNAGGATATVLISGENTSIAA